MLPVNQPQEVNFFLFLAAFGLVITVVYWFASYEVAGTVLLLGYVLATGAVGLRLVIDPGAALVRRRSSASRHDVRENAPEQRDPGGEGPTAAGTGGIDRPFNDEEGRIPGETLAPFAVGLGVAIASTASIFGPAPLVVGLLPLGWGAWAWLRGASDELQATDSVPAAEVVAGTADPPVEPRDGGASPAGRPANR
jgi:hypothetical protein